MTYTSYRPIDTSSEQRCDFEGRRIEYYIGEGVWESTSWDFLSHWSLSMRYREVCDATPSVLGLQALEQTYFDAQQVLTDLGVGSRNKSVPDRIKLLATRQNRIKKFITAIRRFDCGAWLQRSSLGSEKRTELMHLLDRLYKVADVETR